MNDLYQIEIVGNSYTKRIRLHIDQQSFFIGDWLEEEVDINGQCVNTAEMQAEWFKRQLGTALDRMIRKAKGEQS